jgi:hypothetical protein
VLVQGGASSTCHEIDCIPWGDGSLLFCTIVAGFQYV